MVGWSGRWVLRSFFFATIWVVMTVALVAVLLRDIATHEWIREIVPSFTPGGRPLPARFAPAIFFRNYPALGTIGAASVAFLPAFLLTRLGSALASRIRRTRVRETEPVAHEEPADHPPVVRNVRSSTPPLS